MSAVALFAYALVIGPAGQTPPAPRMPDAPAPCPAETGRQGEPVCPGPSHPIPIPYPNTGRLNPPTVRGGPIRASTGDEAGTARREVGPPNTDSAPPVVVDALTGRPVGQPAAAGLGAHVQRGPATRDEPAGRPRADERPSERSPD